MHQIIVQELTRELKPGEVSLDDLERAFQETEIEIDLPTEKVESSEKKPEVAAAAKDGKAAASRNEGENKGSVSSQSIRVNVETLEQLMTMVSELVLTRNQLLEIVRRHEDSEFKVPLQRLSNVTAELQEGVMQTRDAANRQCLAETATDRS